MLHDTEEFFFQYTVLIEGSTRLFFCVRTITQLFLSVKINSDTFFKIWYFMMYLHYFDYFFQKLLKMLWVLQIILDISAQQMIMIVILSKMMIYSGM